MKIAFAVLKMLRLPNLIIVFLSLFIPYFGLLRPAILRGGGVPAISESAFSWLCVATVCSTLSGYFINDFFDEKIDAINRPDRVVIGKYLSKAWAVLIYFSLIVSILSSAWQISHAQKLFAHWEIMGFFSGVIGLLFLYARWLKCTPVWGNFLVAFCCALVPWTILKSESRALQILNFYAPEVAQQSRFLLWNFVVFAFITNLFREMLKDIEDFSGDAACGCHTLPVIKGVRVARSWAAISGIVLLVSIFLLHYYWWANGAVMYKLLIGFLFLIMPAVFAIFSTLRGSSRRDFRAASLAVKIIMVAGLILLMI